MGAKQSTLVVIINAVLSIIQIILGLYIVLKLFGAATVPFVRWVYRLSHPFLQPFAGIFKPTNFGSNHVLDLSALFALIIYSIVGYLLLKFAEIISSKRNNHRK